MMLKTLMEVAQYYNGFNYRPPRPEKDINSQDITIVARPGDNLAPKRFSLVPVKIKLVRKPPKIC